MKRPLKNKISTLVIVSLFLFFINAAEAKAVAPLLISLGLAGVPLLLGIFKGVASIGTLILIAIGVNSISGRLLDKGIAFQESLLNPEKITIIQTVWVMVRDFVNIFFILILLVIAFATIFNKPTQYTAKELLPKLIIAALLINFSLVITAWVIDLLWVPASVFLKPLGQDISLKISDAMKIQSFFSVENLSAFAGSLLTSGGGIGAIGGATLFLLIQAIFRSILLIFNAFVLAWMALIIWARIPILIGLMIVSPVAWLGLTLPVIKKQSWDAWWQKLFCWGSIPILLFGLVYFTVFFNQGLTAGINQIAEDSILKEIIPYTGMSFGDLLVWLITAGVFLGGMTYLKGFSCSLYGWATGGFFGIWKGIRKGAGTATDFVYSTTGAKGAVGQLQKDVKTMGVFGTEAAEARRAGREDQFRKAFGLSPTFAAQKNLLDSAEKQVKDIDYKFKQAKSVDETNQIVNKLRTKVNEGARDPETLAAINALARKGELDIELFNKAVDNFKDMPLALNKVFSEWKEGKFGGLAKAEDLLTILKDDRLGREAKTLGYAFIATKDGSRVAEKMTLNDYSKGYQTLGRNTKEGREFKKNIGKLKPSMVAQYNWAHRTEEFEPDKMPRDMADAVLKQIEGASAKDFAEYDKSVWDDPNFHTGLTKLLIEKRRQIPGSERKFKQELAKRFIREGKGKQLRTLNEISPVNMKEVSMGEPPEETEEAA